MASFMFHFGYAVRSEKYVVPRTTFVVASYEVRRNLLIQVEVCIHVMTSIQEPKQACKT